MPTKKKAVDKQVWTHRHAAVQVTLPDADVYYIDEKTRRQIEARKK